MHTSLVPSRKLNASSASASLHVDGQRSQMQVIPGSARPYLVGTLHGAGVKDVHDDPDPEPLLEVGRAAHVVDVTVGENECGEARRIETEKLYVPHDLGRIPPAPLSMRRSSPASTR